MEVMDSPLNRKTWQLSLLQAHHYGRKADQLVAKEKYEEAILCHIEAAELLNEAFSVTHTQQGLLRVRQVCFKAHRTCLESSVLLSSCLLCHLPHFLSMQEDTAGKVKQ